MTLTFQKSKLQEPYFVPRKRPEAQSTRVLVMENRTSKRLTFQRITVTCWLTEDFYLFDGILAAFILLPFLSMAIRSIRASSTKTTPLG